MNASPKKCSQVSSGDSVWRGRQRSTFSKKSSSVAVSKESWWCDNTCPPYLAAIFFRARANAIEEECAQHERHVRREVSAIAEGAGAVFCVADHIDVT
jgi:hypothetical protein